MAAKVLILGGSGLLGSELRRVFPAALAPSHADLDVLDYAATRRYLRKYTPDTVIDCTAYHDLRACEENPGFARDANARVPDTLAHWCADQSGKYVWFSTDYVFDGAKASGYVETDMLNPLNSYGESKQLGEQAILLQNPTALVIRTAGLFGRNTSHKGHGFVNTVAAKLATGETVEVVDDVTMTITSASDLALEVARMLDKGTTGIVHRTNAGTTSWYAVTLEIKSLLKAPGVVVPRRLCPDDGPSRPKDSALASYREPPMRHWKLALWEHLRG